jgi:hypothetical protein
MIQVILTAALFTVWWAVLSGIPQNWRWPAKPFQCVICLPVYIAPVLYYVPTEILNVVTVTFAAPVVAWVIHGLLQFLKQNLNGNY